MLFMGKSTISTGPFSIAFCNQLQEGKQWIGNEFRDCVLPLLDGQREIQLPWCHHGALSEKIDGAASIGIVSAV